MDSAASDVPVQRPGFDIAHQPVLEHEAIEALAIMPSGTYVDVTFGRGGHSVAILRALGPAGRLIAFDRDPQAVACAVHMSDSRFEIIHAPFSQLESQLAARGIDGIDGLLADLGVSSPQIDTAARGFSFRLDGPLDMRMDTTRGMPLSEWLDQTDASELKRVIADYGEERFAVPIANAIAARCAAARRGEAAPLVSTGALAELVAETLRRCRAPRERGQHPATRTFQALRIHINGELEELAALLSTAVDLLRESGRLAIISFHSIEDRLVKRFIRARSGQDASSITSGLTRGQSALVRGLADAGMGAPARPCLRSLARIRPGAVEVARNPRARSATLRVAQKLSVGGRSER
jgi:16S rRNA (cytosine1402-N4)-methyltransferase